MGGYILPEVRAAFKLPSKSPDDTSKSDDDRTAAIQPILPTVPFLQMKTRDALINGRRNGS
jgi:hypothetical protein